MGDLEDYEGIFFKNIQNILDTWVVFFNLIHS
jgi:hypothetical protein